MEKKFIKMNNNTNQLSLGNFIQIVKKNSINKHLANQSEIFCIIFDIDAVNDSTVNNYCIGARSISDEYKDIYLDLKAERTKNNNIFFPIISKLVCLIKGLIDDNITMDDINNNKNLKNICISLYNISKNDNKVQDNFSNMLLDYINKKDLYNCLVEVLLYIVLEHKQPIYISDEITEKLEDILFNTNISFESLQDYLKMLFGDGINYDYTIKKLAEKNNPYALFELGLSEYLGRMTGIPRFNIAFDYFSKAAQFNHPRANYIAGRMLIEGSIGTCSDEDIKKGLKYLKTAEKLNNIACLNVLGQYYLKNGEEKKAIDYLKKAASHDFVYAYNNLGKIYENKKQYDVAFNYYLKSANLEESWACNKIGEMYRLGIGTNIDLKKSFEYYTKALEVPIDYLENYAKYNLAIHFYMHGNYEANVEKDEYKAVQLLIESSYKLIESQLYLLCYYVSKNDNENVNKYKNMIEHNPKFNMTYKKKVEDAIKKIKVNKDLKIEL